VKVVVALAVTGAWTIVRLPSVQLAFERKPAVGAFEFEEPCSIVKRDEF
jgi:hypothetical protein